MHYMKSSVPLSFLVMSLNKPVPLFACPWWCAEVGVGAGVAAVAAAGIGAEVQSVNLGENQESTAETGEDQEYQLNYVKILLLENAGEAVIVIFLIIVVKVMRTIGIVDISKLELLGFPLPMNLGSIP